MRGLSLMIQRLTRMIQGVYLLNASSTVLIMVAMLAGLEAYLGLSNWDLWAANLLMLAIGIFLLTLLWHVGEKKSHEKSVQQASPGLLWAEDGDSLEIQCLHCGKRTTIQCRVVWPIFSIPAQFKLPKRSRTQH